MRSRTSDHRSRRGSGRQDRRTRTTDRPTPRLEALEPRRLLSAAPVDVNTLVDAGAATVTASPNDIGSVASIFDGNLTTLYRSAGINPAFVQVAFVQPRTLHAFETFFSHNLGVPAYRWMVETADNQTDMDLHVGSYAQVVDWTIAPNDQLSTVELERPAHARLVRLNAERMTGDDYLHLNEWTLIADETVTGLVVEPVDQTLAQFSRMAYQAFTIDIDGIPADVTDQVDWSSTDEQVATVDATGLVSALAPGVTVITATLDTLSTGGDLEVVPYVPLPVDLDVTYIERTPRYDYDAPTNNPAPGDRVTFRGHVRNWGDVTPSAHYRWEIDGVMVSAGVLHDLWPDEQRVVEQDWIWRSGPHTVRLVVDPTDLIAETSEQNNAVSDRIDGLAVGFWVEQSVHDYFHAFQHELGIGSNSWEDWAQRQMGWWNQRAAEAIYPIAPQGGLDRVRVDRIIVVPDGTLPLNGGRPSNHPDTRDRTVDLMWGFPASLLDGDFYANHTSASEANPFYFEPSLVHELGHARYLIDNYGYDVANNESVQQVQILEDGVPVAGSPLMPFIAWDSVLYYNQHGGVMTGPWRGWSAYETAALNLIAGRRASEGNYNAPGNIGVFLNDLPARNHLRFVDDAGQPLVGADVRVHRAEPGPGWYGKVIDDIPDLQFTTDDDGAVHLGPNPFTDGAIRHTYGEANGIAVLRVEHAGTVWYRFMEVPAFNMARWRGDAGDAWYTYQLPAPGAEPVLAVYGYDTLIADGDATPDGADHTDFGQARVSGGAVTRQYALRNLGGSDLNLTGSWVRIDGPDAGDFELIEKPGPRIVPGAVATFRVRFDPTAAGGRSATIVIDHDAAGSPYTFAIAGAGTLPDPAEVVRQVMVGSTSWGATFGAALGMAGLGAAAGPAIHGGPPGAPAPFDGPLPWTGLDLITIVFDGPVSAEAIDIALAGTTAGPVDGSAGLLGYDADTWTATWQLPGALWTDRYRLQLSLDGAGGAGSTPAALSYAFDVAVGDVNGDGVVSVRDVGPLRAGLGHTAGETDYAPGADLGGDGLIDGTDVAALRARVGTRLPADAPVVDVLAAAVAVERVATPPWRVVARAAVNRGGRLRSADGPVARHILSVPGQRPGRGLIDAGATEEPDHTWRWWFTAAAMPT